MNESGWEVTKTEFFNSISWMAHDLAVVFVLVELSANRMTYVRAHAPFVVLFCNLYVVYSWFFYWENGTFYYAFLDFTVLGYLTPVAYLGLNAGMYFTFLGVGKICAWLKR